MVHIEGRPSAHGIMVKSFKGGLADWNDAFFTALSAQQDQLFLGVYVANIKPQDFTDTRTGGVQKL